MKKLLLFCFLFVPFFMNGQVNLITTTYNQDFNALTTSTTASTWTDNSIIVGVYAQRSGNGTTIVANAGASNSGALYSYGNITGTLTDRALGSIGSSGAAAGNFAYGLRLKNNLSSAIASLTITYTGEQWRFGVAGSQVVNFSYQTSSGAALTSLSPSTVGVPAGFTAVTTLDFTSPITSGTVGALDGNLAANRTTKTATITFTTPVQIGGEILLRWGDPDHAGSDHGLSVDDVSITAIPEAPSLTAPTTIPAFNYVLGSGPSTAGSYTLSGAALTPTAGDITVTAPTNFEVSKTGVITEFTDNVTVAYTGGGLANTTVYARLKTGLPIGNYMGNITHSGGGVTTPPTVALSGSVTAVPPPVITTTGTLSTFYTVIGTPSASQSYTVEGVNLVSDIVITAPTDFEIKTGAGMYANTLNLTPSSGTVTTKTIDVRLKGTNTGTYSGNISHASTNVSPNVNVAVNGIVGANCGTPTNIAAVRATIPVQRLYTEGGITTIAGRVTARLGTPKFYLQDATGGIAVYSTNNGGVAQANNIAVGDSIILMGQIYRALGESEIFNPTCVTKISTGTAPAPVIFNANMPPSGVELNTFLAANEGKLVKIVSTNVLSSGTFVAGTNYTTITCNSQGGTEIRVDAGATTLPGSAIPTATQDITGVVGHFISTDGGTDKLQMFPRSSSDLVPTSGTSCTISGGCGVTTFTDSPTQLDVFNWNIEWLGHPNNGPSQSGTNDATQIANAQTVLNGVGADVYMLQEICQYNSANPIDNTTAFGKLVQGLNTAFGANTYSGECSAAVSGSVVDANPQRVCIIYKNSVVTKIFSRPMFNGFTPASYPPTGTPSQFWASGRKPFMFMAKVEINSKLDTILFVGLHAKAGSDTTSYKRRKFDVRAMYDTLQTQYPTRKTIVLGDLNDDVDKSITKDSISTYRSFLYANPNETAINGVRPNPDWNPIAKTLSDSFCASTAAFPDYIDHQIISNEMSGTTSSGFKYVTSSVSSFRPVITNYASTTSDHYPTIARYQFFTLPITSIATGNWSSPTTWDCNCVPTATDNVVIDTPHTVTVDAASQAKSINLKGIINYLAPFVLTLGQ